MSRHALVTGGAGFIGSHVVDHLLNEKINVSVIDDFSTGTLENLPKHSQLKVYEGSVEEVLSSNILDDITEIYHLAAVVGVEAVAFDPFNCVHRNVLDSLLIIKCIRGRDIPLIFTSSSEVYGTNKQVPFKEDAGIEFGSTNRTRWTYGCSKAIVEQVAHAENIKYGSCIRIVRLFNIVGPRQQGKYGMVLPRFVKSALLNSPIQVYGDGHQTRCFCDVRDASRGLIELMSKEENFLLVNMGGTKPIRIIDLAQSIISWLKSDSKIVHKPFEKTIGHGFDDIFQRVPDLVQLNRLIHWNQYYSLKQSVLDLASSVKGC